MRQIFEKIISYDTLDVSNAPYEFSQMPRDSGDTSPDALQHTLNKGYYEFLVYFILEMYIRNDSVVISPERHISIRINIKVILQNEIDIHNIK